MIRTRGWLVSLPSHTSWGSGLMACNGRARFHALIALTLVVVVVVSACDGQAARVEVDPLVPTIAIAPPDRPSGEARPQEQVGPASVIVVPNTMKTTDGALAAQNVSAQLDGYVRALAARPDDVSLATKVVDLRLLRAQFTGRPSDFTAAMGETQRLIAAQPKSPDARLLRARVLAATHRFDEALVTLDSAAELGALPASVSNERRVVELAQGVPGAAKRLHESSLALVAKHPSFGAWIDVANARWKLGDYTGADEAFVEAAKAYRNTAPFALAFVAFQRGVMWAETAARGDLARPLYAEAVSRVPAYHVATVHLAEMLAEAGQPSDAIAMLASVAETSEDPEPLALLSHLLRESGDIVAAEAALARAKQRYQSLLAEHPAAYADHGAEFFTTYARDLTRATALAEANLALRKVPRAYDLAIGVALEAERPSRACQLAHEATRTVRATPVLAATVTAALTSCGETPPEAWLTAP